MKGADRIRDSIAECSLDQIGPLRVGVEHKGLLIVEVADTERESAFQPVLEFVPIAGLEIHEKEIALGAEHIVDVIPVVDIIERVAGITARERDVPGFGSVISAKEIRSPVRQADALFSRQVEVCRVPRRFGKADSGSFFHFGVHPGAVEHEVEFRAQDAPLVIDQLHSGRADLTNIFERRWS